MMSCDGDEAARAVVGVDKGGVCGTRMVSWERLIPRVSLRVLLVEADESTRQVIAALLRKCNYKVLAVSDGLKAWEVLKGKRNGIDLILMEMELPSVSGFALLTLIMEHDSCKNIPVIMMSKNGSVNMIYKCMMRGAADFLVKPVRKNELQNLWQHVWRRQASASSGQGMPDESITQQNIEGLLDNDLVIDDSNGACTTENEECNEKGNDALSSCSVPDLEAEIAYETTRRNSKSKFNKPVAHNADDEGDCTRAHSVTLKPGSVLKGSSVDIPEDGEDPGRKKLQEDQNTFAEASDNNDALVNCSREAIDLIGTFQNHSTKSCINLSVSNSTSENDLCPRLDLSLRTYDESRGRQDITLDERRNVVHQSDASAFSRYKASNLIQPRECEGSSNKLISSPVTPSNFHINNSHINTQTNSVYQESSDLRQGELPFPCPQLRMFPVSLQVSGVKLERTCTSYGSSVHPSYYNQTIASLIPSPDSSGQREVLSRVPNPSISSCSNRVAQRQDLNLDNGVVSRLNSFGSGSVRGSNGSSNPIAESKAEGMSIQDENTTRALQREAALIKFRQKRKDRCFEKKVRYESRKKLAEQRPRVKGQFVRQVPTDPSSATMADV